MVTLIVRRPHAYKFAADHGKPPIPGLVVLDAEGATVDSIALPAEDAEAIVRLIEGREK